MKQIDSSSPEVARGYRLLNGAKIRFPESPVEIRLYYGRHGNQHPLDDTFADDLHQADVFSMEAIGWQQSDIDLSQRIADGDQAAFDEAEVLIDKSWASNQRLFAKRIHRHLFGSNVQIHRPDVPRYHPYLKEFFEATKTASPALHVIEAGGEKLVSDVALQDAASVLMRASTKRDKYVLEHFFPKNIEPKPILRVIGFFGLMHSVTAISLAREAAKQGRDDITVLTNHLPESPALLKFLNKEPLQRQEIIDLLLYWAESPRGKSF